MFRVKLVVPSLILSLSLSGCGDDPVTPQPGAEYRRAMVAANGVNKISAVVTITALRSDSAAVRAWRPGEAPVTTPAAPFGADSIVTVPVLGLHAASSYAFEVIVYDGSDVIVGDTLPFPTGALPTWIPQASIQGTDTTAGYLALAYPDGPVLVDNTGRVVWYLFAPSGLLNSFHAHANGRYTLFGANDPVPQFRVLDALGQVVDTIQCIGYPTRFHDIVVNAASDAWIMCDDTRTMDLSAVGGLANASVMATVVQHVDAGGTLLFEWNAFDHFQITDLPAQDRAGANVNFTHGNGIAFDDDGNLLMSFRSLSEVTKIDIATGQVLWRMGGLANQFTLLNDPKGGFERQHGLRKAGPGEIQFLDNGLSAPSRFVRYRLDEVAKTADLVFEFIDAPTTFTFVGGGTQYYPSGGGLVTFGRAGRVVEVTPLGTRAWELLGIDGQYVFAAQRVSSLYAPGTGAIPP